MGQTSVGGFDSPRPHQDGRESNPLKSLIAAHRGGVRRGYAGPLRMVLVITAHDEHVVEAIGGALWRKNTDDATIPTKPESELFGECRGGT